MDRALYFISEMYCHRLRALMEAVAVGHPSRPRLAGAEGFDEGVVNVRSENNTIIETIW